MNGVYKVSWGDSSRPNQRFYLTFNKGATKGPFFTFTLMFDKQKKRSFFYIGLGPKYQVWFW